jgi:hypothetical protein
MNSETVKVFISYTHDSEDHKERVLQLSEQLNGEGVDCTIDQYEESPAQGWARWMNDQVDAAHFVLVVATETYERRYLGREVSGKGLGGQWEGFAITQDIYEQGGRNDKFIPVIFEATDSQFIPRSLRSATHYRVDTPDGYEDLYRRLTRQPRIKKPPLGPKRVFGASAPAAVTPSATEHLAPLAVASTKVSAPLQQRVLIYKGDDSYEFIPAKSIGGRHSLR